MRRNAVTLLVGFAMHSSKPPLEPLVRRTMLINRIDDNVHQYFNGSSFPVVPTVASYSPFSKTVSAYHRSLVEKMAASLIYSFVQIETNRTR